MQDVSVTTPSRKKRVRFSLDANVVHQMVRSYVSDVYMHYVTVTCRHCNGDYAAQAAEPESTPRDESQQEGALSAKTATVSPGGDDLFSQQLHVGPWRDVHTFQLRRSVPEAGKLSFPDALLPAGQLSTPTMMKYSRFLSVAVDGKHLPCEDTCPMIHPNLDVYEDGHSPISENAAPVHDGNTDFIDVPVCEVPDLLPDEQAVEQIADVPKPKHARPVCLPVSTASAAVT